MSLILDALRKSEAERRRGQAPDLHSPSPLLTRIAPRRRSPWPFVLAAIAVIGLVAAAWLLLPPRQADAPVDALPAESAAAVDAASATDLLPTTPAPSRAPVVATPPPPVPEPVRAPTPPLPDVIPPTPVAPTVLTPTIVANDTPASVATPTADQDMPTIAALSASQRAAMPPMKMSMHVWAEQPADRFVIIDGQRVGEGSRLPGAVVAQIRQNGVVLDVDGRLYLLPRP